MLADALEHLVRGVVDHPDDVVVRDKQLRRGSVLEVRVHPDDLGKVIGRGGRTATAFRTVVAAIAGNGNTRMHCGDPLRGAAADPTTGRPPPGRRPFGVPGADALTSGPWRASRSWSAGSASRTASGAR